MPSDEFFMKQALNLAEAASGQTSPNPAVGAVIVKEDRVVGFGAHLKAGEAHAEVHALEMAGEQARGSTLFVTLEPCGHVGRTGPCTEKIVSYGIARVVTAVLDPHAKMRGESLRYLKEQGIDIHDGICEQEAFELNRPFFHFIQSGEPFVTLKLAGSLDGKTATISGESQWITGVEARLDGHEERHMNDAILVGVNTVIEDDPSLTTRLPGGGRNPIRVVLDRRLRTPLHSKLVIDGGATWIFTEESSESDRANALHKGKVRVVSLPNLTMRGVLRYLAKEEVMTLLVEGGASIHGAFLQERAFQRVISYVAPRLIGGSEAPGFIGGDGVAQLDRAVNLRIQSIDKLGKDIKITSVLDEESGANVHGDR